MCIQSQKHQEAWKTTENISGLWQNKSFPGKGIFLHNDLADQHLPAYCTVCVRSGMSVSKSTIKISFIRVNTEGLAQDITISTPRPDLVAKHKEKKSTAHHIKRKIFNIHILKVYITYSRYCIYNLFWAKSHAVDFEYYYRCQKKEQKKLGA